MRERAADDLGQGREDRVLQFGQHQADQPGPFAAQLGRALVTQDVQGRQDRFPGAAGNPGLAVQDPAHRGLADPDLLGHVGQPPGGCTRHAAKIRHNAASFCVIWLTQFPKVSAGRPVGFPQDNVLLTAGRCKKCR